MRIFEFEKLVAVLARVTRAFCVIAMGRRGWHERERERCIRVSLSRIGIGREYAY